MAVNSNQNSESDVKNKAENILRELGVQIANGSGQQGHVFRPL